MSRMLFSVAILALACFASVDAWAQCTSCAQPVVAFSPVVQAPVMQPAPQPVVWQTQTTTARDGWYPGKVIGNLFRPRATTTVTTNYAPAAPSFVPVTAGYVPQTVGYAPQMVSYAPTATSYTAAYRPTFPPSYSLAMEVPLQTVYRPIVEPACNSCGTDPCGCTSCAMPVTMSAPGCSSCGQASTAAFAAPSSGCASCSAPASFSSNVAPSYYEEPAGQSYVPQNSGQPTPAPSLGADENPAAERSVLEKPPVEPQIDPQAEPSDLGPSGTSIEDSSTYFEAPQLYDPRDRTTRRPTAPVWNAVYEKPADSGTVHRTSLRVESEAPAPVRRTQVGFEGWTSAAN
ncbi:hypothetical protein Pla175_34380 [Pirellulimonas nuda]|uniref:Uncharacterized protein n=2 Tax=Pirellulimonas nuda TaxID=2528009 RepID=A0A518DEY7_9BACT|nr:hypothetical protein Pla175_34380 [Pirellulimonas nuda]